MGLTAGDWGGMGDNKEAALFAKGKDMANSVEWTPEAEARLKEIPFFVRPAARKKIEKFAQEQGALQITEAVYEAAKKQFG